MNKGYNLLAPFYDRLALLVIGKQIQQAQLRLLPYLKDRKKLLILGGGTGWILPHIHRINPGITIHYVDVSEKMIAKARTNANIIPLIRFVQGTEETIPDRDYDAILTHFYLDLFTDAQLPKLITSLKMCLNKNALWLVTDFETHTTLQRVKVKLMYLFFRIVTGLRTSALPNWYAAFAEARFTAIESHYTKQKFIRSVAFTVKSE